MQSNPNKFTTVANMSFEQKEHLHDCVSSILEKVTGRRDVRNMRLEKSLARFIIAKHNSFADKATKSAINAFPKGKGKFTKADKKAFLSALERGMKGFPKSVQSKMEDEVYKVYLNTKKDSKTRLKIKSDGLLYFVKQHGTHVHEVVVKSWLNISKAPTKPQPPRIVLGSIVDTETSAKIATLSTKTIGDHVSKLIKETVAESIDEGVLDEGLNKDEARDYLRSELTRKFGTENVAVPDSVAVLGENAVNAYFENLVATTMNFAQNFARVNAMEEAGIARYRIAAVIDAVTSDICTEMNGKEFELSYAKQHMQNILDAEDVDGVKEAAPWVDSTDDIPGYTEGSPSAEEVLAANGMAMTVVWWHCHAVCSQDFLG